MRAGRKWIAPSALLLVVVLALGWLFKVRLGGGDLYPLYSSLRADALGTRALYEALAQIDGMQVERDYRPLAKLGTQPRLIVLPGLNWERWQSVPANQLDALNAAARNGARVLLAFRADVIRDDSDEFDQSVDQKKQAKKKADEAKKKKEAEEKAAEEKAKADKSGKGKQTTLLPGEKEWELKELAKEWKVAFKQRWLMVKQEGAQRTGDAPASLPALVAWQSDVHFSVAADSGWRVLYRRAGEAVLVEKTVGRGSIVLMADAYCLSNEAMQRDRATALLSYLVGDYRRVSFVESVLGVLEDNGVGFLARRYGLGGALALCVLLAALYAWRRLVAFLPVIELDASSGELALAYEPAAGFTGLLRRSLGAAEILPACVAEWHKTRRSGGNQAAAARLDAAWQAHDPKQSLVTTYNALARTLKPR